MRPFQTIAHKILLDCEPERAHRIALKALKYGMGGRSGRIDNDVLKTKIAGLIFPNPLGIAAGFDKNGEVPDALLGRGMGFAEVGTVTPRPQEGNPKPRIFRLQQQGATINRLGFNNQGHNAVYSRLLKRRHKGGIVGVNIGANKDSSDFISDYVAGIKRFYDVASYLAANISSPNTPGLRNLQAQEALDVLFERMCLARAEMAERFGRNVPIFLKIAPDIDDLQIEMIGRQVLEAGIDGLIVSNTTISREAIADDPLADEVGGLAGKPLFTPSTVVLAKMRRVVGPELPIIGVGGISNGVEAVQKIRAGANLLQVYTGLIYRGLDLIDEIKAALELAVQGENTTSISDLVGLDVDALIEEDRQG